jgi:hypothetical protein
MTNKKLFFGLLVLGIFIISSIFMIPSINKVIAERILDIKPTKQPIDPYKDIIQEFQNELQRTDLPIDAREFIEGKLGIISLEATQRAEGQANQPTRQTNPNFTPQNIIGFRVPDGIDDTPEAPFSRVLFTPLNSWRRTEPDHYYLIFAGHLTEDIQQGALYILQPDIHTFSLSVTPTRNGAVRVVAENGTIITVQSTDNTLFYFNAATEQFVNAQGTPFPVTPTPFNSSPSTPIPYP